MSLWPLVAVLYTFCDSLATVSPAARSTLSAVVRTACLTCLALHAGGFKEPKLQCGVLPCEYGGMPCVPSTQADTDVFKTLLALNNMSGDCFAVWGVARGSDIPEGLVGSPILNRTSPVQYTNGGSFNWSSEFSKDFNRDGCYLKIRDINSTNPDQHVNHTKNVLCTAGLVPSGYDSWNHPKQGLDPQAAGRIKYQDALVNMTTPRNLWFSGRTAPQNGSLHTWYYMIEGTTSKRCPANASSGCACSDSMIQAWDEGNLMFVTYAPPGRPKGVYAASLVSQSHPHFVEFPQTPRDSFFNLHPDQVSRQFQQATNLYAPPLFLRENVAVYDESHIRCFQSAKVPQPTLCMFSQAARDNSPKWYSDVDGSSSVFERQCGPRNSTEKVECTGLAVNTQGALIMTSKLGDFGYEVIYDEQYIDSLGQQTGIFAFSILGIALGLYACVFVAVWCCRRLCRRCA